MVSVNKVLLVALAAFVAAGCSQSETKASAQAGPGSAVAEKGGRDSEGASLSLGSEGLKLKASDGKGSKVDIDLGSAGAHIDAHDAQGNGAHVHASGDKVDIGAKGDGGSMQNNVTPSQEEMAVDFYPGSEPVPVASLRIESKEEKTATAVRSTADPFRKVVQFYEPRTNGWQYVASSSPDHGDMAEYKITLSGGEKKGVRIERNKGVERTIITIVHSVPRR